MIVGKIIQKGNHISTNNQFIANQYSDNLELQVELTDTTFENFELSFFYGINGLEKTGILEYDKLKRIIKLPFSAFDGVRKLYISCAGITTESDSTVTVTTNYIIFYNNETIDPNSVIEIQNGKTWMEAVHEMVLEEFKKLDLGQGTTDYNKLKNTPSINDVKLEGNKTLDELGIQKKGNYLSTNDISDWAKAPNKPNYNADEVGALSKETVIPTKTSQLQNDINYQTNDEVVQSINNHNISNGSHNDIRLLIQNLSKKINSILDSDDVSLDQLSEIVAYIKTNKNLIDAITTSKLNVTDIINNLTTVSIDKPLSASMGVELKKLIDNIKIPTKLSEFENDVKFLTEYQGAANKDKALVVGADGNIMLKDLSKIENSKVEIVYRYDFKGDVVELNQLLNLEDDVIYTVVLRADGISPTTYVYLGSNSIDKAVIGYLDANNNSIASSVSIYQFFIRKNQLFTMDMVRSTTNWSQIYIGTKISDNTLIVRGSDVINNKTSVIVYKN